MIRKYIGYLYINEVGYFKFDNKISTSLCFTMFKICQHDLTHFLVFALYICIKLFSYISHVCGQNLHTIIFIQEDLKSADFTRYCRAHSGNNSKQTPAKHKRKAYLYRALILLWHPPPYIWIEISSPIIPLTTHILPYQYRMLFLHLYWLSHIFASIARNKIGDHHQKPIASEQKK